MWYDGCAPKECTLTLITNRGNVFNAVEVPSWKEAITFSAGTTVIINNTEIVNTPRDPPLLFVAKNGDVHGVQSTSFYSGISVSPNTRMVVDDLSYKTPLVLPQNPSGVLVVSGGSLVPAPAPKTTPTPSCPLEPTKTEHVGKASNFDIEDNYV